MDRMRAACSGAKNVGAWRQGWLAVGFAALQMKCRFSWKRQAASLRDSQQLMSKRSRMALNNSHWTRKFYAQRACVLTMSSKPMLISEASTWPTTTTCWAADSALQQASTAFGKVRRQCIRGTRRCRVYAAVRIYIA